ncbi:MAG: hypothetical protein VKN72_27980 [Nostocales cyanobacterium 94392]|nr:hypothetical protein [Nostocales cyanobacterium 94392]
MWRSSSITREQEMGRWGDGGMGRNKYQPTTNHYQPQPLSTNHQPLSTVN